MCARVCVCVCVCVRVCVCDCVCVSMSSRACMLDWLWTSMRMCDHTSICKPCYKWSSRLSTCLCFCPQPNTFQLVIAYDPSRYQTFIENIYIDMRWDHTYLIRPSMIGHLSYKEDQHDKFQFAHSMKSTAFRLHQQPGNTGEFLVFLLFPVFRVLSEP